MSNTVTAIINYSTPPADGSKSFIDITRTDAAGKYVQNWTEKPVQVEIEDLRGKEDSVTLDTTGFQYGAHKSAVTSGFYDEEEIKNVYYPESVTLIKQVTGASHALIFDHTIRRRTAGETRMESQKPQPAQFAHVDQSHAATIARVHRNLSEAEASQRMKRRFQIINLWRPISHPATDMPLALCDYRSVDFDKDMFPNRLIFSDREGEALLVLENPNHKWKYVSGLRPDEYVLIKCGESREDVARRTPHTAFADPTTPADAPARQSIELRALVFYD